MTTQAPPPNPSPAFLAYGELDAALCALRDAVDAKGWDPPGVEREEDQILAAMDETWWLMSEAEREWWNGEPR